MIDRSLIKCPKCDKSYFREDNFYHTSNYYPAVYKNGIELNPDKNITTVFCKCMYCDTKFIYQQKFNKVYLKEE